MLYYVQPGDSLYNIANKFNTSVQAILNANIICNSSLIYINQPILIPEPNLHLPVAGGSPYYIVLPGDTLWCLASKFNTTIKNLAELNKISNPNFIRTGSELLVVPEPADPAELKKSWETLGENCDFINTLQIHGILYFGSFAWEGIGRDAFSYLLDLLDNPCDIIRYYAVISLSRIGENGQIQTVLDNMAYDPAAFVAGAVRLAKKRIELLKRRSKRTHVVLRDTVLLSEPNLNSQAMPLNAGRAVISLKWHMPSPTGEEGPRGDIQMYDIFQDITTGRVGYLPRALYREITVI